MSKQMHNKKGLSPMIAYILLISFAIVIASIVYVWIKTYVPKGELDCPEGVSLMIKSVSCSSSGGGYTLTLSLKNNGRFNVDGYFIIATKNTAQEELVDISGSIESGGVKANPGILRELETEQEVTYVFEGIEDIKKIEIVPMKNIQTSTKDFQAQCTDSRITEDISCT